MTTVTSHCSNLWIVTLLWNGRRKETEVSRAELLFILYGCGIPTAVWWLSIKYHDTDNAPVIERAPGTGSILPKERKSFDICNTYNVVFRRS